MHDRVVGNAAAEWIVFGAILGRRAGALLGLVRAPARLLALAARGCGTDLDGVRRDLPPARALRQALELVGGLVDRLQVALVLVLASGWRDVGVPALGHAPARELHVALVERRLELQQEQMLLDVEDRGRHDHETLATLRPPFRGVSRHPRCSTCWPIPDDRQYACARVRRLPSTARHPQPAASVVHALSCEPTMSSQYIFTMHRLSKLHPPNKTVLDDVTLAFYPGAKIGVLGYNGAGKSTLLRIMAGVDQEYRGEAALAPGASVGMLEQEPHLDESKDVKGNVEDGVAATKALLDRFNELAANYSEDTAEEFGRIQAQIEAADAWNLDTQLEYAMDALRLPPPDADVSKLSGGERRRVALCRLLLRAPDLLLLDEPTNHLDAESVAWLEQHLSEYKGAIVAVTHDRYFLDNVAGWILELDRGKGIPYEGNYSGWLEQKQTRMAQEERSEKGRERTIAAELEWVRTNPKGKRTKSKARLARYEELVAEERNVKLDEVQIHIPPGPRLGEQVLTAEDLRKGFGERLLIEDLSFDLPRAGIVGVIGANGAGKTTLFRMITGEESPDSGSIALGETVQLAYVDQSRDALDPAKSVWEEISEGYEHLKVGEREVNSRQYTAGFNFKGSSQQAKIGSLSGGERNRVHLAKLLRSGGNLLLLDEPTNDLDVDTLRALENALLEFPGCAVIISHDRWFLDRVATHVLAFEGDSQVTWFEGNFEAYEEHRRERLGAAADRPHRITYKRLVRG